MAFYSLPAETKSLARTIYKFKHNTGNKKAFCMDSTLQELVNCVAAIGPINPPLLDVPKKRIKVAASASSRFYDSSWLTDTDKFPRAVAHFDKIISNSQIMDFSLQQSITSAVTSVFAIVITTV